MLIDEKVYHGIYIYKKINPQMGLALRLLDETSKMDYV